jgi:hypothetical protein
VGDILIRRPATTGTMSAGRQAFRCHGLGSADRNVAVATEENADCRSPNHRLTPSDNDTRPAPDWCSGPLGPSRG